MIDKEILDKKYGSKADLVEKLDSCPSCPFEDILKYTQQKEAGILYRDIKDVSKKPHPHRKTIEEVCGRDVDEVCYMKYLIMRMPFDDYMLSQFGACEIFKMDLEKGKDKEGPKGEEDEEISLAEAIKEWGKDREDLINRNGNPTSYAARWREVWDVSLNIARQHVLTEIGMYKIVVSKNGKYSDRIAILESLSEEERERHLDGIAVQ